jgi:hypothetical protein
MQRSIAKVLSFAALVVAWTYFRIYLSMNILWSVWFEFDLIPYVVSLLPLHTFSLDCVQARDHALGTGNGSLARTVDEIPDFHPSVPPATAEYLLVFLDIEDLIPVCRAGLSV